MGAAKIDKQASPPADLSTTPSKKRKTEIDEIEVDLSLPEPPSKKAKRLIKKGKPLPVKPNSDDEAEDELPIPKAGKDGSGKDGKPKRSEHGIWVGNLAFTVTRVELFKWLVESSGGAIKEENITRVNLPMSKLAKDRNHGTGAEAQKPQNRGFAYVDFDAEPAAVAAMALTETELDGRKVLIKNSKSFEGRPQKETANENGDGDGLNGSKASTGKDGRKNNATASRKIYVGNLSFQTGEDDLRAQFEKCGEIEWAKVATFEDSGKCKGYGWVKFKEAEAAEWAVKGFVKIKEEVETEDDFRDDSAKGGDDEAEDGEEQERKFKMRKWWVNRLRGRELKIDFAEDDQVRYKKRFGKDAPARAGADRSQGGARGDWHGKGAPRDSHRNEGGEPGGQTDAVAAGKENTRAEAPEKRPKKMYGDAAVASYLTGAVVKSQGKKTTFD